MEQKNFEQIIEDYDFACILAKRFRHTLLLEVLSKIYDDMGYRTFNFTENEFFDMYVGDLTLTYSLELKGIDNMIEIWYEGQEYDTDIDDFKNNLGLAMLSHTIYRKEFYEDHDKIDEPVCFDEFLDCEWQDEGVKKYYIERIKTYNEQRKLNQEF